MNECKTPLNQLPTNSVADSDLVNKILNQLDEKNATDQPTLIEETNTNPIPETNIPTNIPTKIHESNIKDEYNDQIYEPKRYEKKVRFNDEYPTPSTIQKTLKLFNTPQFHSKLKFSILIGILFLIFMIFSDTFKGWFAKLPIQTVDASGIFNKTGIFLQAFCFGLVHLAISIFLDK